MPKQTSGKAQLPVPISNNDKKRKTPLRKDGLAPNCKHGLQDPNIKLRFSDLRTKEAQSLNRFMQSLHKELGETNGFQDAILTMIRAKVIVAILLAKWIEEKKAVVHDNGEVPRVIDVLRAYTKSIEDSMQQLKIHASKATDTLPSIQELMAEVKNGSQEDK